MQRTYHSNYLNILIGIEKATDILKENIILKEKLAKFGYPLEHSFSPLSVEQQKFTEVELNNREAGKNKECNEQAGKNSEYDVTPEEKQALNNFYATFSYIPPRTLARVLSGKILPSTPTYQEILRNIKKLEVKNIDYYKNLYWKSARASENSKVRSVIFAAKEDHSGKEKIRSRFTRFSLNKFTEVKKIKRKKSKR